LHQVSEPEVWDKTTLAPLKCNSRRARNIFRAARQEVWMFMNIATGYRLVRHAKHTGNGVE
jgi:hypothetical protein